MGYIKDSPFYKDAIHEFNFSSGNYYLFDTFVVAEINEGVLFTWEDHAKPITEEFAHLYDNNGEDIVYISNRVNLYSVKPSDWVKFFRNGYKLRGYGVVSYTSRGIFNSLIEKLFMRNSFQSFDNLSDAISWAKQLAQNTEMDSENEKSA
ncbi:MULTISPECIES: hypothetical protein [Aquimarina]|uniref:hypothetical protein n=1 Tax=Aquimarina TaxID=290174 RepID=UPI0009447722|nr:MULTISPECIES: hypothetical protein [Aquimarina]